MEILKFDGKNKSEYLSSIDVLPAKGFIWLDIIRGKDENWVEQVEKLAGISIHEKHITDTRNLQHPSFYDSTSEYEMIIFRGLACESDADVFTSRPTVLFLFKRMLVTIREQESRSIPLIKENLKKRSARLASRPVELMHLILSASVDRFLELREPITMQLEHWRHNLLNPKHPFNEWMSLMVKRDQLRTLELLCEEQEDAVTLWRDNTDIELEDHIAVRYRDLVDHIRRVTKFASHQQSAIESLVQLHFSAVAHRTNEVVRVLTVISAIFLPLTLVAGIFGMNFVNMPELHYKYGYYLALGGMAAAAIIMLVFFRWKRWF